jgi:ATP-dependent Clp protease, protease subunit
VRKLKKVFIKGAIISNDDQWIYDWLEWDATSPRNVQKQLAEANGIEDIEVEINSGGGSVFDASEIYTSLKEYKGKVTSKIVGIAASAASVIAMASDHLKMSPTSQMMIHNASISAYGDHRDMSHMADVLKNVNQTVANAYKLKSGKSDSELLELMNAETWFTPQQAFDHGLIDEIMFENENANNQALIVANFQSGLLPPKLIEKIKNKKLDDLIQNNESDFLIQQKSKLQLQLLKLGGSIND